jgi:hypothetical protein
LDNISRCLFDKMAFDKFITLDVSRDCYSGWLLSCSLYFLLCLFINWISFSMLSCHGSMVECLCFNKIKSKQIAMREWLSFF